MQGPLSRASTRGRRIRLGLVGALVAAGLVAWSAGIASASAKKPAARPSVGRVASANPKVGHLGTKISRAVSVKSHAFMGVTPAGALRNYSIQQVNVLVPNGTQRGVSAPCPTGTVVMGGGAFASSGSLGANLNASYPLTDGSAWNAYESNTSGGTDTLTSYAICAKRPRYYSVVENTVDNPSGTQTFVSVACPATYKVLGVGALGTSADTAVTLNGLSPYKTTHPTTYNVGAYVNNGGTGDDTAYALAVCGKLKGWSLSLSSGVDNPPGSQSFVGQACPSGSSPTGGGVYSDSGSTAADLNATYPNPGFTGWGVYENNGSASDATIYAYALCAL
jgi:hypothetical protein